MNKHIKILAGIYIFIGILLALSVTVAHLQFFSSPGFFDRSVINEGFAISEFYNRYVYVLGLYGFDLMSVVSVLLTIISSLWFGVGILRGKKWAVYLGFLVAAVGIISIIINFSINSITISSLQILLSGYTFWVLLSKEMKEKIQSA